ncbi:MAG: hypothetical protein HYV07_06935 [Deltaproteobacteria bacterium]|nr:hypothetical protein [Deltaproteobacteria bacterium]
MIVGVGVDEYERGGGTWAWAWTDLDASSEVSTKGNPGNAPDLVRRLARDPGPSRRRPFIEPSRLVAPVPTALQQLRVAKQGDGDSSRW